MRDLKSKRVKQGVATKNYSGIVISYSWIELKLQT